MRPIPLTYRGPSGVLASEHQQRPRGTRRQRSRASATNTHDVWRLRAMRQISLDHFPQLFWQHLEYQDGQPAETRKVR